MRTVLDYLDRTAAAFPEKVSFRDEKTALTFAQLREQAMRGGSALLKDGVVREPVAVYMSKTPDEIAAFMKFERMLDPQLRPLIERQQQQCNDHGRDKYGPFPCGAEFQSREHLLRAIHQNLFCCSWRVLHLTQKTA